MRQDHDRGYESDRGPDAPYFPPPPRIAVDEPQEYASPGAQQGPYIPRPYNPAEYGARPGSRDDYFAGHPQEQQPYAPPPPPGQQDGQRPPSSRGLSDRDRDTHSSIADRYRPSNYHDDRPTSPYARSASRGSNNNGSNALALRHPSPEYPQYSPPQYSPYDSEDDERSRRHRGKERSKSRDSRRSNRSRASSAVGKAREEFTKHKKDLGAGALGAIAGGIIGNAVSGRGKDRHGGSKKNANLAGMLIGAAIGGIGAAALENRHERSKMKRRSEKFDDGYDSY